MVATFLLYLKLTIIYLFKVKNAYFNVINDTYFAGFTTRSPLVKFVPRKVYLYTYK